MLNTIIATAIRIRRALIFKTGQTTSYVTGDDGDLEIGQAHNYEVLTTGQYSGTTSIPLGTVPKTEVKNNACVMDHASGLMWARTVSASVGPTSNGLLPFTVNANLESIFLYAASANAALLAGYGNDADPKKNWRVPNAFELLTLCDYELPTAIPDITAFPSGFSAIFHTSNSQPNNVINVLQVNTINGTVAAGTAKTATALTALVRGPL